MGHVKTTTEKTTVVETKITETTVTTTTEDPKEPEIIQAERVEDEPEVVEEEQQKSSVPQSNLEEVDDGEGEDIIQAVRCETPKFFPPKEESDTQSVQSRKSSSASQKKPPLSPHIKSAPKNQTMNKFDLSMGLKEKPKKKDKKPSGFSKFINMSREKFSKNNSKPSDQTIEDPYKPDPQRSLPHSPKSQS